MSELDERLKRVQDQIDEIKPEYDAFNKRFMLKKEEATRKAEIGTELYRLNIEAIGILNELHKERETKKRDRV